ncbi:MAG: alpha/beta hydrolase [Halieaceae bacterium]|nr:alpha/beta hydrolase [Halieaceae bacterium]
MSYLTRCKTQRMAQSLPKTHTHLTLLLTILGTVMVAVIFTPLSAADNEPTAPPHFSKAYIDLDWGQIHSHQATPSLMTQRTLVCFPPNPFSGNYYRHLMASLAIDRRVVALDYPGLGQSDPSATWRTVGDLAEIMIDAIESARLTDEQHQSIDVCGYHTGAMVAAEVAIRRPDLVRSVILIGVPYFADQAENDAELQDVMQDRPLPTELAALESSWRFTIADRHPDVVPERAYDNFLESAAAWRARAPVYRALHGYAAADRAVLITQPALVLNPHGGLKTHTRAYAQLIQDVSLVELPHLSYGVFDVAPEQIADIMLEYLDR